jgi:hypothetical protein
MEPESPGNAAAPPVQTVRQRLRQLLAAADLTVREISQALGISEKEVITHLPHLERSLAALGRRLARRPCLCLACGFRFEGRRRFSPPSRCPRCRAERVRPSTYHIT